MRRQDRGGIKKAFDVDFGPARDDDFEPRSVCSRIGQNLQEDWTVMNVTAFIECVNDNDESVLWVAREGADEIKEERILHRLWCQVWVVAQPVSHNGSKKGEASCEFVDETRKDISELARICVIPPAEQGSSAHPIAMQA